MFLSSIGQEAIDPTGRCPPEKVNNGLGFSRRKETGESFCYTSPRGCRCAHVLFIFSFSFFLLRFFSFLYSLPYFLLSPIFSRRPFCRSKVHHFLSLPSPSSSFLLDFYLLVFLSFYVLYVTLSLSYLVGFFFISFLFSSFKNFYKKKISLYESAIRHTVPLEKPFGFVPLPRNAAVRSEKVFLFLCFSSTSFVSNVLLYFFG